MATSGSFVTNEFEGRSLTFSWNRTAVDIVNNRSTIAWSVKGSGSYTEGWVTCGDIDVVVNGATVYNSSSDNRVNVWSGTVVASGTSVISHDANGNKSFSASINAAVYNYAQNVSGSKTFDLDAIPRAASIDKVANTSGTSISSLNTGNALRVYFTPKSTAFKYRVSVSMNGNTYQNDASGVSVSSTAQTYYQPAAIPHSWIPNSTSGTVTCKLETLNGTTVIGTSTHTITMDVPTSVIPTISAFSSTPYNSNSTISGWNIYVANYSKARLSCTAAGNSGSTIAKFQISGAESTTVNGTSLTNYDVNLTSGGIKTFNIVAIDSRGRSSASKSVTINVETYYTPSIASFDVIRTDANGNVSENGTAAKLSFVGYYSSIGSNASTAKFSYKLSTATTYTAISTTVAGTNGGINGGIIVSNVTFSTASEYDFQIQLSDSLGNSVSRTVRLGTVTRTMNVAKYGNGVAIGKMSTVSSKTATGKLEVGWDADFDKNVNIDGNTTMAGNLVIGGSTTIGSIANIKSGIDMGGLLGQTKELAIRFSNPTTSTNHHNTYIYGGNPNSVNAIGCYDGVNKRSVMSYSDADNKMTFGDANTTINFKGAALADFIVEQGTTGDWYYRKWNSGRAECWGNIGINTAITNSIGSIYYAAVENIAFPSGLFVAKPLVFANATSTAVLTVAIRGSTTTKSVFGVNLMYPVSYPNSIIWEIAVEAKGTWK